MRVNTLHQAVLCVLRINFNAIQSLQYDLDLKNRDMLVTAVSSTFTHLLKETFSETFTSLQDKMKIYL